MPQITNAAQKRAAYDDIAPDYEAVMRPFERLFLKGMRQRVFDNLPQEGRILEVGAGTGLNFKFYPAGVTGAASELSREMLSIAQSKKNPEFVQLVQSCAEDLPFEENCFDAAFATLVMCSVESPLRAIGELRRVVRPGGRVVLLDHVRPEGLLGPVFDLLNLATTALFDDHLNRRTAEIALAAGLNVIKREKSKMGIINLIVCRV